MCVSVCLYTMVCVSVRHCVVCVCVFVLGGVCISVRHWVVCCVRVCMHVCVRVRARASSGGIYIFVIGWGCMP